MEGTESWPYGPDNPLKNNDRCVTLQSPPGETSRVMSFRGRCFAGTCSLPDSR